MFSAIPNWEFFPLQIIHKTGEYELQMHFVRLLYIQYAMQKAFEIPVAERRKHSGNNCNDRRLPPSIPRY